MSGIEETNLINSKHNKCTKQHKSPYFNQHIYNEIISKSNHKKNKVDGTEPIIYGAQGLVTIIPHIMLDFKTSCIFVGQGTELLKITNIIII